ncbi:MAG: tetratricopeptide repeat protein, partial [bacterium]
MTNVNHKIISILGLALMLRLVFFFEGLLHNPTFFAPIIDAYTYNKLALAEVYGGGMGPESVWQPLFYPYFLSACYYVFGDAFICARIVHIILGLLTCILTYLLGARLCSPKVGLLAMAMVAVAGPLIFYEGELLPTTWGVFWFLLSIILFVALTPTDGKDDVSEKYGYVGFFVLGLVCAVGVMIRPSVILFYLFSWIWLLTRRIRSASWGSVLAKAAAAFAGVIVVFGPVLVRNHALTRKWVLLPLSGGLNFYIGNNPEADKTVAVRPGDQWYQMTVAPRREGVMYAQEGPAYFYGKSWEYIKDQPLAFMNGLARKTMLLISSREVPRNIDVYLFRRYSAALRLLVWRVGGFGFPLGIILPFALFGMVVGIRQWRKLSYLYLYVIAYSFSIVLYFVSSRYRLPLFPALCIFAASGVLWLWQRCGRRKYGRLLQALVLLAAFFILCNKALTIPEDAVNFESEMYMALGTVYLERNEIEQGRAYIEKSVELDPRSADSHNLLGRLEFQQGRLDRSEAEFSKALSLRPDHVGALRNLGHVYRRAGRAKEAADYYRRAADLDPGSDEVHYDLASLYDEMGNASDAAREYWRVLEIKPDSIIVRRRLSLILAGMGKWEMAEELLAEAV